MTINLKNRYEKVEYDVISALSSGKVDKYK